MPDGAADQPAHDITASLAGGQRAISHQEGCGAEVLGNNTEREVRIRLPCQTRATPPTIMRVWQRHRLAIGHPGLRRRRGDQGHEEIGLVGRRFVLEEGHNALEAGAGVYAGALERRKGAIGSFVVLVEDRVPELEETTTVVRSALIEREATAGLWAEINVDLRVWPARTGL